MFYQTKDTPDGSPRWSQNITMPRDTATKFLKLLAVIEYRGAYDGHVSTIVCQMIEGAYKRNHAEASFKTLVKAGDKSANKWLKMMATMHCLPPEYEGAASGKDGEEKPTDP